MKKLDRFIRKVTPLMDKELNENLPLYSSISLILCKISDWVNKNNFSRKRPDCRTHCKILIVYNNKDW